MRIEVVYALPLQQDCSELEMRGGATVAQAIEASGVLARNPQIDLATVQVGIWGRRAQLSDMLRDRDRVEIYRPLRADPKEIRRQRAAKKGAKA
mgnify:CR=1 FL=1